MELYGRRLPVIDDYGYRLTQDLYQANLPEFVASPLRNHQHCLPGAQRPKFSSPEVRLYYGENLLPVPLVGVFLLLFRAKPQPVVFIPHS